MLFVLLLEQNTDKQYNRVPQQKSRVVVKRAARGWGSGAVRKGRVETILMVWRNDGLKSCGNDV